MFKVCARWALRLLQDHERATRVYCSQEFVRPYEHEGEEFLDRIVTNRRNLVMALRPEDESPVMYMENPGDPSPCSYCTRFPMARQGPLEHSKVPELLGAGFFSFPLVNVLHEYTLDLEAVTLGLQYHPLSIIIIINITTRILTGMSIVFLILITRSKHTVAEYNRHFLQRSGCGKMNTNPRHLEDMIAFDFGLIPLMDRMTSMKSGQSTINTIAGSGSLTSNAPFLECPARGDKPMLNKEV
ncbi:hypothetical protein MAR_031013 [Mya arenaria]|uniref:Uncharacterized protein n=1 Tax=Mya arenaria TaxID=6604 RepID=A0ABY7F5G6_MYAAR|nr:hypothetical protein MAR_031013 [Mya arenaria]